MMKALTLVQQNDTHAHIAPHWELRWRQGEPEVWRAGGHAHIRSIVDGIRAQTGGACIHVDSGDALHGTGPAQWTEGGAIVPALKAAGVEIMTPGNWDFGFGPDVLRQRVRDLAIPVLAANVARAGTREAEFARMEVREAGACRIAFLGVTTPIVGRTMPRAFGAGLSFLDAFDVLPELIASVRERERPDLVVLVSHYGFAQEVALARTIDGIDVILGGHTHDLLIEPVIVGRTIITQSGAHGSYLTRLDLEVSKQGVCGWRHALIPVEAADAHDDEAAGAVAASLEPFRPALDEVVGETQMMLHRGTVLTAPMDTVITEAYRAKTGADVAVSPGWRYGTPIPAGPITAGDLWQMVPTNPEIFTVRLTGAELRRLLEGSLERTFSGDALRQQGGYVMRFAGMQAVARINNPAGTRIQRLEIGGTQVVPSREYVVAGAGEQSLGRHEDRTLTGVSAIDALRAHLSKHRPSAASQPRPALVAI